MANSETLLLRQLVAQRSEGATMLALGVIGGSRS
ncbi:hypothetical protein YPC_2399 [Yersinia pestis biovar Medievalis str. Harbin 35]|nr:hypothetical protein YPC_2399 [Yersinia pestis biovar Medievalis str. Harbin 35]EEO76339.1 hypothetical protein YP516_2540 [Yersinia pestis Nepal516]EEO81083.1 hypothetical protein YPF_2395 [Yersinia pestis biovar Orientalis str. India 195]EEO83635.1 hypothetical protein YPH_4271 [Yersinia pestis biovar Orientalis str. PEXU2]EEO89264.1 hypothetical protein YPS_4133 [Yersinia pestis Pestoides A]